MACRATAAVAMLAALAALTACSSHPRPVLTFSGSSVGAEGAVIRTQLARFAEPSARTT